MEDIQIIESIAKGEKINSITPQQLSLSRVEKTVSGGITSEVTSMAALNAVSEIMDKKGISFRIKDIWAINNQPNNVQCGISISRELEDIYTPGDVRTMLFRRLYMMLDIEDNFSDKTTGNIVISYHQDGIEFAFGDNVRVCSNLCIYGGEVIRNYALYGNRSIPFSNMLEIMNHWMDTYDVRRQRNVFLTERLKERQLTNGEVESFFGDLVLRSARHSSNRDILAPLNMTQSYDIAKNVSKRASIMNDTPSWNINTAWDLYNGITEQHKVDRIDSSLILYQANSAFNLLSRKFDINPLYEIPVFQS